MCIGELEAPSETLEDTSWHVEIIGPHCKWSMLYFINILLLLAPISCQQFLNNRVVYASDIGVESIWITKSGVWCLLFFKFWFNFWIIWKRFISDLSERWNVVGYMILLSLIYVAILLSMISLQLSDVCKYSRCSINFHNQIWWMTCLVF